MRWLVIAIALSTGLAGYAASAGALDNPAVVITGRMVDAPLVLDQYLDYELEQVEGRGGYDGAAVVLRGDVRSVSIRDSRFGLVTAGGRGQAAGIMAEEANIGHFQAVGCEFYDIENELLSLSRGHFGHVIIERCTFRTSESFLREIVERNPWRDGPPVAEFANIDRLELLDVEFDNTKVIIHPSVKQVILRGDIREIEVIDPGTQVMWLGRREEAERLAGQTGLVAPPGAT